MIINATHIGEKIDGIGRFSLYLAKFFLQNRNYEIVINEKALIHFNKEDIKKLKIVSKELSPDYGFKGHIKRLFFANRLKGDIFTLSQLEVNFFNKHQIIVLHDLIPLLFPKWHLKQYPFFKYLLPLALKNSKKIVTVSNHTKKLIEHYFDINNNKIEVIYNGIEMPIEKEIPKEDFILYVGREAPTKNLDMIVKSFLRLKDDKQFKNIKLFLVGINKKFKHQDIKSLGYVNEDELDSLYRKAKVFLFPSLYEGFGFPVLEAMSRKTAVITSNVSSLPEIVGDSAILVNPLSLSEILNSLKKILLNINFRKELEIKGFERAKQFSLEKMLYKYQQLLDEI
jgi:glycosyltransferase involved in cell wall biosynthesis